MRVDRNKLLGELLSGVFIIFWFLVSYLLSYESLNRFVPGFIESMQIVSFLIFLPHGIRVISVYFLGYKAVLPLFIAHLMLYQFFDKMPSFEVQIPLALVGALSPLFAFELLRICDLRSYYRPKAPVAMPNTLGTPLLAGLLAAIFNGLLTLAILMLNENPVVGLKFLLGYFIGDLLGVVLVLGLLFTLRALTKSLNRDQDDA